MYHSGVNSLIFRGMGGASVCAGSVHAVGYPESLGNPEILETLERTPPPHTHTQNKPIQPYEGVTCRAGKCCVDVLAL